MSKYVVKYRSRLNDFHSVRTILEQIILDKINDKNAPQKDEVASEGKQKKNRTPLLHGKQIRYPTS